MKTLYQTIYSRRSVRKYADTPVDEGDMDLIMARLGRLIQLKGHEATFDVVARDFVTTQKAPHYIIGYCGTGVEDYINMGYCLQEMDLYIQSLGLGTLWLGGPGHKPVADDSEIGSANEQSYCIMLGFGVPANVPERDGEKKFSRIKIKEIGEDNLVTRAVRLAPSAVNSQPWKITFDTENIRISYKGRGLLRRMLYKKMSKIDIGIAAKHAILALIESGKIIEHITPYEDGKDFGVDIGLMVLMGSGG